MKKIKTLPALQVLIAGFAMFLVKTGLPAVPLEHPLFLFISLLSTLTGAALILSAGYYFKKAKTTVNPIYPDAATQLVIQGIYRYSRNPMYLGFVLLLCAWGLFLGDLITFIVIPAFILIITYFQIIPEERALTEKFGEAYKQYLVTVRRWI